MKIIIQNLISRDDLFQKVDSDSIFIWAGKYIVSKMHIINNIVSSDHMPSCLEIECDIVSICNSTFITNQKETLNNNNIKEPRDVCKWNLARDKEKLSMLYVYMHHL